MRGFTVILGSLCLIVVAEVIRGPSEVSVRTGDTLSVTCEYDEGYESYVKYWCKGAPFKSCDIVSSSAENQGKYSLQDNPSSLRFIVTGREMTPRDTDTYFCGIEKSFRDHMHSVRVTVLPGLCRKPQNWASMVHFPPGFESIEENKMVAVSCKEQYEKQTIQMRCLKKSNVFQLYPQPNPLPCIRRCVRMDWGQNISTFPVKEYYDRDEEVTVTCPEEYRPNYSKIRCVRKNTTNMWNVSRVSCVYSPVIIPHSMSWGNIRVSCCFGVLPSMVVKLIIILTILTFTMYDRVKRRSSSKEEEQHRNPDMKMMKSSQQAATNLYQKGREDQDVPAGSEMEAELIYVNMEAEPDCDVYTSVS